MVSVQFLTINYNHLLGKIVLKTCTSFNFWPVWNNRNESPDAKKSVPNYLKDSMEIGYSNFV